MKKAILQPENDKAATAEATLDSANEMSFPASDPIATSNIERINVLPEQVLAAGDHQNSATVHANQQSADPVGSTALSLTGVKIAALVTDGFEQEELLGPKHALEAQGALVHIISDKSDKVQGFKHTKPAAAVPVDHTFDDVNFEDYDGILLPGGVVNGDAMRMLPAARDFVRSADQRQKPIAAICHGGWLLISAGIASERTVTSWPSLQDDFSNAGSHWLDQEVVQDKNLVSSRKPADIPAFNEAFISLLRAA